MIMQQSIPAAVALLLLTSGCASLGGPPAIVGPEGALKAPAAATDSHLGKRFEKAFTQAAATDDAATALAMLRSGFSLVDANCNLFFQRAGKNQRTARIARDAIAPITAILTGVLAIQDFSNRPGRKENILQAITLATAGSSAALDIYEAHFLFGSDNIDSVQTQTLTALAVHRQAALGAPPTGFDGAVTTLMQNQNICMPPTILSRVKAAIKNSPLAATNAQGQVIGGTSAAGAPAPTSGPGAPLGPGAPPVLPGGMIGPPAPPVPPPPAPPRASDMGIINVDVPPPR